MSIAKRITIDTTQPGGITSRRLLLRPVYRLAYGRFSRVRMADLAPGDLFAVLAVVDGQPIGGCLWVALSVPYVAGRLWAVDACRIENFNNIQLT